MSKVNVDILEPLTPNSDITLGAPGGNVTFRGAGLRTNIIEDSGGNVLIQSDGDGKILYANSAFDSDLTLLDSQVATSAASIQFKKDIDPSYNLYTFKFINLNPASDGVNFEFQVSTDYGHSYGVSMTTTAFMAYNDIDGGPYTSDLEYLALLDLADEDEFQPLSIQLGWLGSECSSGELNLFNPSNTDLDKQFYSRMAAFDAGPGGLRLTRNDQDMFVGGFIETDRAIDAIKFQMSSGSFDGIIKMYGL